MSSATASPIQRCRKGLIALLSISLALLFQGVFLGATPANAVKLESNKNEYKSSGPGGIEFRDNCPDGSAITSYNAVAAQYDDQDVLVEANAECTRLSDVALPLPSQVSKTPTRSTAVEDDPDDTSCGPNDVAVGAIVYNTADPVYVSGLKLKCASFYQNQKTTTTSLLGSQSSSVQNLDCPKNHVVTGLWLRADQVLDAFGIRCAGISDIDQIPLERVILSPSTKAKPFEAEITISRIVGGSIDSDAKITGVKDGIGNNGANGCRLSDNTLTAETPGICVIEITKSGDGIYNPIKGRAYFTFTGAAIAKPSSEPTPEPSASEEAPKPEPAPKSNYPIYDPKTEPDRVAALQISAYALLALTTAGLVTNTASSFNQDAARRRDDEQDQGDRESGDVASADVTALSFYALTHSKRGDNSRIWRLAHRPHLEERFKSWVQRASVYTPLGARIFLDGSYLRAMLSGLAIIPTLLGAVTGTIMLLQTKFLPEPASFTLFAVALALSTLDSLAGLTAAAIVFTGTLLTGNITTLDQFMTSLGIAAILIMPGIIAGSIRPIRRLVTDKASAWERITDFVLATLLGGWAIQKVVASLNGLSGLQLPLAERAVDLGYLASLYILIRLLLEDISTHHFPERLAKQAVETRPKNHLQPWYSIAFKTSIFYLVAYQYLGLNAQLLIGTAIFLFPQLLAAVSEELHAKQARIIGFLMPRGATKVVLMVLIGGFFADWAKGIFKDPGIFISWSFVILAVPGFIIGFLKVFAAPPKINWKAGPIGRTIYMFGGIIIAALIFAMHQGVDLYQSLLDLFK